MFFFLVDDQRYTAGNPGTSSVLSPRYSPRILTPSPQYWGMVDLTGTSSEDSEDGNIIQKIFYVQFVIDIFFFFFRHRSTNRIGGKHPVVTCVPCG